MKVLSYLLTFIVLLCTLTGCKNFCKRHKYDCNIIIYPTCEDNGLSKYICSFCGDYYYQIEDAYYHSTDKKDNCFRCDEVVGNNLNFTLNANKNSYSIYDNFLNTNSKLIIPEYHLNLPVTEIAEHGFENTMYQYVVIAPSVTKINSCAFKNSTGMISVKIYSTLSIEDSAFLGCLSLKEIHLYKNINYIGDNAFKNCLSLETIHFYGEESDFAKTTVGIGNEHFLNAQVIFHPTPN